MTTRRQFIAILTFSVIAALVFVTSLRSGPLPPRQGPLHSNPGSDVLFAETKDALSQTSLDGHVIAPKLGNATAKAELGRAAWKLFHTMMARFPEKPTDDEKSALKSYIHLFQRLYPCGECAGHFGEILKEFPPQVSSRNAAAGWACHVHNQVNESLNKELFDCTKIGDFYDCGCADDEEGEGGKGKKEEERALTEKPEMSKKDIERMTGAKGRSVNKVKEALAEKIEYVKVT
jgi:FAD-linked sulfhydryl oxidase